MELKPWKSYSEKEKKSLLMHAFRYYGKSIFNLAELEEFEKLCSKRIDDVFLSVVIGFMINAGGPTMILYAIRSNQAENLLNNYAKLPEDAKKQVEVASGEVLSDFVRTYNNPEPDIPLSPEQIAEGINNIKNRK